MKFYRSVITITIVDTVPLEWDSLHDICVAADNALCSIDERPTVEITAEEAGHFALASDAELGILK